jgi:lipopolysaccharide export LptBFGC system permease protein LptF
MVVWTSSFVRIVPGSSWQSQAKKMVALASNDRGEDDLGVLMIYRESQLRKAEAATAAVTMSKRTSTASASTHHRTLTRKITADNGGENQRIINKEKMQKRGNESLC